VEQLQPAQEPAKNAFTELFTGIKVRSLIEYGAALALSLCAPDACGQQSRGFRGGVHMVERC